MCVTCLVFSALTLFSPVTEAPQLGNGTSANVSNAQAKQVKLMPVAEDTRISIAKMLKQMPNSPETRILREEFKSLQAKLSGVKDDAKAEVIIDDGLNALSKRVVVAPNSDRNVEVLFEMREAEANPQLMNSTQSKLLQGLSLSATSHRQSRSWGWLS